MLFSFAQGKLPRSQADGVDEHLSRCPDCRTVVAEAARFLFQDQPREEERSGRSLEPGTQVSRYVIGEIIGIGAAGVVYRARDPHLKRDIALKLLRADPADSERQEAQGRLLREAQSMAQLSHSNVVTVFDVGTYEDQIFIVMELVEGQTLARWLAVERPAWPRVVAAFVEAGRGLAAAHAVQIVHRDFKPANVLVGKNGRVCVTDFGLARPMEISPPTDAVEAGPSHPESDAVLASLTATVGGLAGTPTFMAPEQFLGRPTVARTDQFSFSVALYMALFETHPFAGDSSQPRTLSTLAKAVVGGQVRRPLEGSSVPSQVFDVLARGLSSDPEDRFGSMDELLDALTHASSGAAMPARRRRPYAAVKVAAALAIVGLVTLAVAARSLRQGSELAAPAPSPLAESPAARSMTAAPEVPGVDSEPPAEKPAAPRVSAPRRPSPSSVDRKGRGTAARPAKERYDNGLKEPF